MNYKNPGFHFLMFLALFVFLFITWYKKIPLNTHGAYSRGYGSIVIHYGLNDSHSTSWVQRSPAGVVGIVYGKGIGRRDLSRTGDLIYKTILADGSEKEEVVTTGCGADKSILLYDSQSYPHVFTACSNNSRQVIYHFYKKKSGTGWLKETAADFSSKSGKFIYELSADIDKNDSIHLLVLKSRSNPDSSDYNWAFLDSYLFYITNRSGNWEKQLIHHYDMFYTYDVNTKTLRRQDIKVDKEGYAHVVFGEQIDTRVNDQYSTGRLHYATNKTGKWVRELALEPLTNPHEAGWNPSLCLDKTGRPVVASTYVARVRSRSISYTRLQYSVRQDDGNWETTVVADEDDGYYGNDGRRYTGGLPHLKIDDHNRAHIVFSDIASSHGPFNYVNIGQIRYAVFNGTSWEISTIYRQPRPKAFFKAREMGGQCLAISGDGEKIRVVGQELTITGKFSYTCKLVHFVIK